jgi:hypothetical protein
MLKDESVPQHVQTTPFASAAVAVPSTVTQVGAAPPVVPEPAVVTL